MQWKTVHYSLGDENAGLILKRKLPQAWKSFFLNSTAYPVVDWTCCSHFIFQWNKYKLARIKHFMNRDIRWCMRYLIRELLNVKDVRKTAYLHESLCHVHSACLLVSSVKGKKQHLNWKYAYTVAAAPILNNDRHSHSVTSL